MPLGKSVFFVKQKMLAEDSYTVYTIHLEGWISRFWKACWIEDGKWLKNRCCCLKSSIQVHFKGSCVVDYKVVEEFLDLTILTQLQLQGSIISTWLNGFLQLRDKVKGGPGVSKP